MPSAAAARRSAQASAGVGSRAARPLAFDGPGGNSQLEVPTGIGKPAVRRMGGAGERSQAVQGSKYGMLPVARAACAAEHAAVVASASPLVGPTLEQSSEPDSAERLPKRQRLPMTPLERGHTPCRPEQGARSPFSAELPPRWKRSKRLSDRAVNALPDGAAWSPAVAAAVAAMSPSRRSRPALQPSTRAGHRTASFCSPPSASVRGASAEGRAACSASERQVVPETPARSSPTDGTAAMHSKCEGRLALQPRLDAHSDGIRGDLRLESPRIPLHAERATRPVHQAPAAAAGAAGSLSDPQGASAGKQSEATAAELGTMQPHGCVSGPPSEPAGAQCLGSCGGDADLPDACPVIAGIESNPLCPARLPSDGLALLSCPMADAPLDAVSGAAGPSPAAGLPLLSGPATESPPSELGSVVPGSQSPADSPSDPPHSKRQKSGSGHWRRQSCSEPVNQDSADRDHDAVPETLPWDAGCSAEAAVEGAVVQQRAEGEHGVTCGQDSAEATAAQQPGGVECKGKGGAVCAAVGQHPAEDDCALLCSQEPPAGFAVELGEPVRCALSSPDGR